MQDSSRQSSESPEKRKESFQYDLIHSVLPQVLRDTLNCTLPIELIYNGPAEMDQWAINKFQVRHLALLHKAQRSP